MAVHANGGLWKWQPMRMVTRLATRIAVHENGNPTIAQANVRANAQIENKEDVHRPNWPNVRPIRRSPVMN